jgi:hypothetical protein
MKTILAILIMVLMVSCKVDTKDNRTDINELKAEEIMGEIGHGLYKVKVDDSTTVLIYRGVESCTMIQLK